MSIITKDRPSSLLRLLNSLSEARYFGDTLDLRINVEQDCDEKTLQIAQDYKWPQGSLFIHHRVVHGGLLPAVVESWYPKNNNSYGVLLEDDVELAPLFYAWIKMSLLRYRYSIFHTFFLLTLVSCYLYNSGMAKKPSNHLIYSASVSISRNISSYHQKVVKLSIHVLCSLELAYQTHTRLTSRKFHAVGVPFISQNTGGNFTTTSHFVSQSLPSR